MPPVTPSTVQTQHSTISVASAAEARQVPHPAVRAALHRACPELASVPMTVATGGYSGLEKLFLHPPAEPGSDSRLFLKAFVLGAAHSVPPEFFDECRNTEWAAANGLGASLVLSAPQDGLLMTRALDSDHPETLDGQAPYRGRYFQLLRRIHESSGERPLEMDRRSYYQAKWDRAWRALPQSVQQLAEVQIAGKVWHETLNAVSSSPFTPVRCHGDFNPHNARLTNNGDFAIDWATLKWDDPMYEVVYLSYHLGGDILHLGEEFFLYGATAVADRQRALNLFAMNHSLRFMRTFNAHQVHEQPDVLRSRVNNLKWMQQDIAFLQLLPPPGPLSPPTLDAHFHKKTTPENEP